jgi:signal transduction histidine kinase
MNAPLADANENAVASSHVRRTTEIGGAGDLDTDGHDAAGTFHLRTAFLRRVAHDIASPAGVTTSALLELVNEGAPRPELVAMARRGLRRLVRLSEQLAIVADLESGTLTPDTTREETRTVVKAALEQAIAIDGRRGIEPSLDVGSETERLPIDVDRRLVESVVREVIGNALRLASSRVLVEVLRDGGHALIRIHDDGPGFATETLATLGKRFTPNAATRQGLSLSIAKDVLAAHCGHFQVEASSLPPGRRAVPGAAVAIRLPLAG